MANDVFANSREISCKVSGGKSIAAFPDVCFTPPMTPATPPGVPIPYPNTAFARDTSKGSKKVRISGKEVMLKNKSFFKTSIGDEPGCAPKKGIITSKIKGKAYFNSWSMDVKFEGYNVVRHLDLTTHNHASLPPQTPPTAHVAKATPPGPNPGVVKVSCRPDWDDCQKKQMCAKVQALNSAATLKPLRKQAITPQLQKAKKSWQAKYWRDNPPPKGDWTDNCAKTNGKPLQADHVIDVQWGGRVMGPFKWLDATVNTSIGSQMDKCREDPATGFVALDCGCA